QTGAYQRGTERVGDARHGSAGEDVEHLILRVLTDEFGSTRHDKPYRAIASWTLCAPPQRVTRDRSNRFHRGRVTGIDRTVRGFRRAFRAVRRLRALRGQPVDDRSADRSQLPDLVGGEDVEQSFSHGFDVPRGRRTDRLQ